MYRYLFLISLLSFVHSVFAQQPYETEIQTDSNSSKHILVRVDKMPEFRYPMSVYLQRNLKYPLSARENCIQGKTLTRFVVTEDGSVEDIVTVFPTDERLDAEARRIARTMSGKWTPGRIGDSAVKVYFTLPISFGIGGTSKCLTEQWYFDNAVKLYEENNLERACKFFGQAFRMNFQNNKAGYNYAVVAFTLGKTTQACEVLRFLISQNYTPAAELLEQQCP